MTREEIKYLRIALGIQNMGMIEKQLAKVISTYEAVKEKKGSLTIKEIVNLELRVEEEYRETLGEM